MPKKPKALSDQLRDAIRKAEKRGITRYRIAKDADVHPGQIGRLMAGSVIPKLDTAQRIAEAAGYRLILQRHR